MTAKLSNPLKVVVDPIVTDDAAIRWHAAYDLILRAAAQRRTALQFDRTTPKKGISAKIPATNEEVLLP